MIRRVYGSLLKEAIMNNDGDLIENLFVPIDHDLVEQAHDACIAGDIGYLKALIAKGLDLSHPLINQPECLILNLFAGDNTDYQSVTEIFTFLVNECIDLDAISLEYEVGALTILDIISNAHEESGLINEFTSGYLSTILRQKGAKRINELGLTVEQVSNLFSFDIYRGYNYELMKDTKSLIHQELIGKFWHPSRLSKMLENKVDIEMYY